MKVLVTGSAGHLGEALVRTLKQRQCDVIGLDILESPFTTHVGSIVDQPFVKHCLPGVSIVYHAATLHKPHVGTHNLQQFVDTNITGTLNLLQEAVAAGAESFIFTSTTSVFGQALTPAAGSPAVWVTEETTPIPKNIYGITKAAAEDLCRLFHRRHAMPCIILRTSRFFPEDDDNPQMRRAFSSDNLKVNEYLYRRVDIEDAVSAHLAAADRAKAIGFARYIISATTPFLPEDLQELRLDAAQVVQRRVPNYAGVFEKRGWQMLPTIDRVYVNEKARKELGWRPRYDFQNIVNRLGAGEDFRSSLAQAVGSKGYHAEEFLDGPYPVG